MRFRNRQSGEENAEEPEQDLLSPYAAAPDRGSTQPLDEIAGAPRGSGMQVDGTDFGSRSAQRRLRRSTSRVYPQRFGEMARSVDNRQLLYLGVGVVLLLVALLAWQWSRRDNDLANVPLPDALGTVEPTSGIADELLPPAPGALVTTDPLDEPFGTPADGAAPLPAEPSAAPAPAGAAFVVTGTGTEGLFLRSGPSVDSETLATLPEGTPVESLGEDQNDGTRTWKKVSSPQGEGWVAADFVVAVP